VTITGAGGRVAAALSRIPEKSGITIRFIRSSRSTSVRCADSRDCAMFHDHERIDELAEMGILVLDNQERLSLFFETGKDLDNPPGCVLVELRCRFSRGLNVVPERKRCGKGDTLFLAPGEVVGGAVFERGKVGLV